MPTDNPKQYVQLDGHPPGWIGHVTKTFPITKSDTVTTATGADGVERMTNDDASQFDPPLRTVLCTADGTITFCLAADSATDATKKTTRTLTAGQTIEDMAIRKVFSTGTTGTFTGYR